MTGADLLRLLGLGSIALGAVLGGCGGPGEPEVGKCTNADPDLTVQVVAIEVVDCDDSEATERIVREVKDGSACEKGRLRFDGRTFCTEPL